MTNEEEIARGHRAFSELKEVASAFDEVEAVIIKTLRETPIGADLKVLRLHMSLDNLAAVRIALQRVVSYGERAEAAIAVAGLTRPT